MPTTKTRRLASLYAAWRQAPECRSQGLGSVFVPGSGDPEAALALIGEAPGREEEIQGRPFVGAAGANLDQLLAHIGLDRTRIYLTNLVKFRPHTPEGRNRKPSAKESRAALPYLVQELEILDPRIVVCLGAAAASALLARCDLKMHEANGRTWPWRGRHVLVTYHPSPFNYYQPAKRAALIAAFETLAGQLCAS